MDSFAPGKTTVGFVGIGKMGVHMSRNLRRGDFPVVGYDIRAEALEAVRPEGVQPAKDLAELAGRCDVVITMLPDSNVVDRVVLEEGGLASHLAAGKVFIDMSSSFPVRTKALCGELGARGIGMLGAPVTGGTSGAEAGSLTIMVGGKKELAEAARPLFEAMGRTIVHVGDEPHWGHAMKCINNFLSATNLVSSMEALALAAKAGLDPAKTLEVLNAGSGRNSATEQKWPAKLLKRDFDLGFAMGLMHKDLTMGADMARGLGATLFLLNHVRQVYELGLSRFGAEADQTRLLELIEEWAGQTVGQPPKGNL